MKITQFFTVHFRKCYMKKLGEFLSNYTDSFFLSPLFSSEYVEIIIFKKPLNWCEIYCLRAKNVQEKKDSQSQISSDCSISSVKGVITETPNL